MCESISKLAWVWHYLWVFWVCVLPYAGFQFFYVTKVLGWSGSIVADFSCPAISTLFDLLESIALWCTSLLCCALHYLTILHFTALHYTTVLHFTELHYLTILHFTALSTVHFSRQRLGGSKTLDWSLQRLLLG